MRDLKNLAGIAAIAAAIAACGPSDAGAGAAAEPDVPEASRYGGTAVVAANVEQSTFNPLWGFPEGMWIHQGLISMPLVRYDAQKQVQPWLAERWDTVRVAPDTLELTLRLRQDIRWHDGVPTTAEDVAFTYETMRDPRVGFGGSDYLGRWWGGVEVVDSFTVRFRMRPHAEFLDFWTWYVVMPAHLLRGVAPEELRDHPYGQRPVGNGPFRFVRRVPGQQWIFEANPDFPEALGGRPYLDRIVFRIVPDATARLTELLSGDADLGFIPPEHVGQIRNASSTRPIELPSSGWTQIVWNTQRPPFDEARVRRALSLAIDRRELVDGVLYGHAEPGRWTVTPAHWQYDSTDTSLEPRHDPASARRLLAEAGWRDRDGDGVIEDAGGTPLRFALMSYRESPAYSQIMPVIQAQLRRIGVDVQLRLMEAGTSWALVQGRPDSTGNRVRDFDAYIVFWDTGLIPDDSWLHSRVSNTEFGIAGYANPRADSLMEALAAIVDRETSRPMWREYQRMMMHEAPVTVLYYANSVAAASARLRGVEMRIGSPYSNSARWWLHDGASGDAVGSVP